ncbi:MAG TPA: hypothetical protein VLI65_01235 [Pyrinomonadaceae bacterium]|nr:hypothetical protein [Pyrinomonadaceae bacterium]
MEDWRELVKLGRFADAEPLMLADTDPIEGRDGGNAVARAEFYEAWGDASREPLEAVDRYTEADLYFGIFASWSTSGGEGTARMLDVNRVRNKVRNVKREL